MDEIPALSVSPESALAKERDAREAEARYFAVLHDATQAGEYGITRWLKAHPQAIGEYRHADNLAAARLLTNYIMHRKVLDPADWDVCAGFFIDEILSGARGADADSLARKLARLWEVNGA
jgi:hypothetical protein